MADWELLLLLLLLTRLPRLLVSSAVGSLFGGAAFGTTRACGVVAACGAGGLLALGGAARGGGAAALVAYGADRAAAFGRGADEVCLSISATVTGRILKLCLPLGMPDVS